MNAAPFAGRDCPQPSQWHGVWRGRCSLLPDMTTTRRRGSAAGEKGTATMDDRTFQTKFDELLKKIRDLPEGQRDRLEDLAEETKSRRDRIRSSVAELQESIDYLRLSVKYLIFDLEATRRENAYLRRLVEQFNRDAGDDHDAD
jgi:hypothetical protein